MVLGELIVVCERRELVPARLLEALDGCDEVGVERARRLHHLPEEVLAIDGWGRRRGWFEVAGGVKVRPDAGVGEVGGEVEEEVGVEGDLTTFELVPGAGGGGLYDCVVDVARGDVVPFLIGADCEHGGENLELCVSSVGPGEGGL